jgi:hypothetical protein
MTDLVCLQVLRESCRTLEEARLRCRQAAHALASIRETLDQAVELAYRQQSFRPINTLFSEEEAALAAYEQAVADLTEAEERWCAVNAALAYEKEWMLNRKVPPGQLN